MGESESTWKVIQQPHGSVILVSTDAPKVDYREFFPGDDYTNIALNTKGWTRISAKEKDYERTLPEGIRKISVIRQKQSPPYNSVNETVLVNTEVSDFRMYKNSELADAQSSASRELQTLLAPDNGYVSLGKDADNFYAIKTKIHAVNIPSKLLTNPAAMQMVNALTGLKGLS
jgi:hypothetical protein